jgi:hypothetical protein
MTDSPAADLARGPARAVGDDVPQVSDVAAARRVGGPAVAVAPRVVVRPGGDAALRAGVRGASGVAPGESVIKCQYSSKCAQ